MENDYEENQFFKFNEMYPGHQFACVERLKKSSINDGGFGVFAAREFSADEFVTVYLGKKCDVTYRFGDILALPSNFNISKV